MKISKTEEKIIKSRRKFIKIKRDSNKILCYRKGSSQSKGEIKISSFLISESIKFNREYYFKGLYNYTKTQLLYFDFYIHEYNLCIEYDGQQHYAKDKTKNQQANDFLKNAYCLKNRINFLRIKYTDFDKIEKLICEKVDKLYPIV